MGNWIRKNLVLVAGILLPALLVAGFFLLQDGPRLTAEPPGHDFLVVGYLHDGGHPRDYRISFEVRDGRLQGRATPNPETRARPDRRLPVIYRYEAALNRFSEVAWEVPEGLDGLEEPVEFTPAGTEDLELDKAGRSPDGYLFEYGGYRGGGGLLGGLFGIGRRHRADYLLTRDGAYFRLPDPVPATRVYDHGRDLHFLGWVVGGEASR